MIYCIPSGGPRAELHLLMRCLTPLARLRAPLRIPADCYRFPLLFRASKEFTSRRLLSKLNQCLANRRFWPVNFQLIGVGITHPLKNQGIPSAVKGQSVGFAVQGMPWKEERAPRMPREASRDQTHLWCWNPKQCFHRCTRHLRERQAHHH